MPDLAIFVVLALIVAVAGIRIGMLVAPRLDRMTEPRDEDDDGAAD